MSLLARSYRTLLPSALAASLLMAPVWAADAPRAPEDARQDLNGSWTLNADLSQVPPRGGMEDGTRPTGRVGGGMPGGGAMGGTGRGRPGGGPMGGGAGGGQDPERMRRAREIVRELMEAPGHLSISTDQDAIVIEAPDGRREHIVADGKKHAHALAAGDVTNKATWRDGVLRVETTNDGVKVERRFAIEKGDTAGTRLAITYIANLPMARRPMEVRRVYDRAEE